MALSLMEPAELYRALEEQYFGPNMHEREEIELLPGLLKGVKCFVDVGASLGPYSYATSKVLKGGKIFCIEADPVRVRRLRELGAEWEKASGNKIQVIHAAAADKAGKMDFFLTDANISGALFKHHVPDQELSSSLNWSKTEVDVVTLDELFGDSDPDLIKIDVEGAEFRVLMGARGILGRGKSRFLVEVHPWGDEPLKKTPADVFNLFAGFGYDFKRTHRHWHFQKTNQPLKRYVRNRAIVFILNHQSLKQPLKRLALAVAKRRKRKPGAA
jgi:FkbM family methyltransferase